MIHDQFGEESFHGNGMDAIDWDCSNVINECDLFFDSIVKCSLVGMFPLILDERLVQQFACCCKVFADFVVSVTWALNLVC